MTNKPAAPAKATPKATPKVIKVELWDLDKILPYPKNAKLHPAEQIDRLAAVIAAQGWDQPIVLDRHGVVIKGHGRRLAALKLGLAQAPVIVRRDMSDAEADAARISDNAVSSTAYDTRVMQEELHRLMRQTDIAFGVDDLGLSEKDKTLLLEALDVPFDAAIMDDTHGEIERQKTEDEARVERIDAEEVALAAAFGFKKVSRAEERVINAFIAQAEDATGQEGRAAVIAFMAKVAP